MNVKRQLTSPGRDCCFSLLVPKRDIVCVDMHSSVWLFATPWTVVRQAPLSVGFSRQDNWSGLSSSRGSSQSRDWTNVSCIGRWFVFVFVLFCFVLPLSHLGSPVGTLESDKMILSYLRWSLFTRKMNYLWEAMGSKKSCFRELTYIMK